MLLHLPFWIYCKPELYLLFRKESNPSVLEAIDALRTSLERVLSLSILSSRKLQRNMLPVIIMEKKLAPRQVLWKKNQ